jgi:hypothetical protein
MMRRAQWVAALLLSGCYAHGGAGAGGAGVSIRVGDSAADAIGLGVVAALMIDAERDRVRDRGQYRSRVAPFGMQPAAPPMDPKRLVREHDCTRPIEDPAANLRCR